MVLIFEKIKEKNLLNINILNKVSFNNEILYSFKKFYGISFYRIYRLVSIFGINIKSKLKFFSKNFFLNIFKYIHIILRISKFEILNYIYTNIKNLYIIKSYKGYRHLKNLPTKGQRTHANRKTQRFLKNFVTLANIFENKLYVKQLEDSEKKERNILINKKNKNVRIKKK